MEVRKTWPLVLKTLLGLLFIASAILKVLDMDKFEIYVYSYRFFSLNLSFLVARIAIILELVIGIGLVFNVFHKLMWWSGMAMLAGYTLLLGYALTLGRSDSCHCFGALLPFNPWQSILKNLLLMALFALAYKVKGRTFKGQWMAFACVAVASVATVFIVSPPDNFTQNYRPEKNLNVALFNKLLSQPPLDAFHLQEGKQVVCLLSTTCELCELAARKLSLMQQRYGFPSENITFVFMGNEEEIKPFFEHSESAEYRSVLYGDVRGFLSVNGGNFPTLAFLDHGTVVYEYGLRNMNEGKIREFFTKND